MAAKWRIELFGGLRAVAAGRVVTRFATRKIGALLAYLACFLDSTHPRETLLDLLWPESEPTAGRGNLSQALSLLRQQLALPDLPGSEVIVADRHVVRLKPDVVTTDVAEFDAALGAARAVNQVERARWLAEAVDLYRGPLLAGRSELWIAGERERLAERYFRALRELIRLLEQAGRGGRALEYARRAVDADPLREEGYRELMRLRAAAGEPGAALQAYRQLERLLAQELETFPSTESRSLAHRIASGAAAREAGSLPAGTASEEPLPGLPPQFTRFFGREEEIGRLLELLGAVSGESPPARLVTLTGTGGSGKTRLALAVAERVACLWGAKVPPARRVICFVSLADLVDPRLIVEAVRAALGLPRSPEVDPVEQVVAALSRGPALLLLDNFEHLVDEGALMVRMLLDQAPALACLVTSRRRLDLTGERELPVLPLPMPPASDGPLAQTPVALGEYPSVQLFVDRAESVWPGFQVTPENAADVAAVCRGLEGIPLALELAAARVAVASPAQMRAHLAQRFDFLVGRRRDVPARHRALRATIDWSYDLLEPPLQRFFARLSVFRGGWTLAAAAEVCHEPRALECLECLRASSLILAEEEALGSQLPALHGERRAAMRFRMLETLREYAQERLPPDERAGLEARHTAFFVALAEQAEPELRGPAQREWLERLEAEHENLRAALDWCLSARESDDAVEQAWLGLRLAGALWHFWWVRGYLAEGRKRLMDLISLPAAARGASVPLSGARDTVQVAVPTSANMASARARALNAAWFLASELGESQGARGLLDESLGLWRALGDHRGIGLALDGMGFMAKVGGDYVGARELFAVALAEFREAGELDGIAVALNSLAALACVEGHYDEARALWEESLALRRRLGDKRSIAILLQGMAAAAHFQGDVATARALLEESLAIARELGAVAITADALGGLGWVALEQEDHQTAHSLWEESLMLLRPLGDRHRTSDALQLVGWVCWIQGDFKAARSHYEESLAMGRALGNPRGIAWALHNLGHLTLDEGSPDTARALFVQSLAIRRELNDRQGVGECLVGLGRTAAAEGEAVQAARWLGAAQAVRDLLGTPIQGHERLCHDRCLAAVRRTLDEATFRETWASGEALSWEEAAAEALADAGPGDPHADCR